MGVVSTSSGSAHPPKVWEYNLLLEGKGRSLEEMLFESGIPPVTKEGYRMQWEPFMSYLASIGVQHYASIPQEDLLGHTQAYVKAKVLGSSTGTFSFVQQLSGACNWYMTSEGHEELNPFKSHQMKRLVKSLKKSSKVARPDKKQADPLSPHHLRQIASWCVQGDQQQHQHHRSSHVISTFRTAAALSCAVYKGHRGDTL